MLWCSTQKRIVYFSLQKGMTSLVNPKDFKRVEVAFEIIDTSIEIKNFLKLGQNIQTIIKRNDEVYTIE